MSTFRLVGSAALLVVAALVGGTIIGSVAASSLSPATRRDPAVVEPAAAASAAPAAGEYCADFRRELASRLGVDESALAPAARAAAVAAIADAVADGRMTKAAGDRLTARLEAATADGCALLAGKLRALKAAGAGQGLGVVRDGMSAAAKVLTITPAELGARLRAGASLKDLATAAGTPYPTLSAAVLDAVKADLDKAVAAGTIRQARADRVLDRITRALADGRLRAARPAAPGPTASPAPSPAS